MTIWDRFTHRMRDAMDREGGAPPPGRTAPAPQGLAEKLGLNRVSDEALGTELERRRRARGKSAHRRPAADEELDAMRDARRSRVREFSPSKAYGVLEVSPGAPRSEVERAYRAILRQYHPDRHIGDDEQYKNAVALCTSVTDAYLALLLQFERKY